MPPPKVPASEKPAPTRPGVMPFEEYVFKMMIALGAAEGGIGFTPDAIPEKAQLVSGTYAACLELLDDQEGAKAIRDQAAEVRSAMLKRQRYVGQGGYREHIVHQPTPLTSDPAPKAGGEIEQAFSAGPDVTSDPYFVDLIQEGKTPEEAKALVEAGRAISVGT